ncbi:MAG: hypothetical protein WCK84_00360 [Bacteroidota bacterium]
MIKKIFVKMRALVGLIMLLSGSIPGAICQTIVKQGNHVPINFCIGDREMNLYKMIDDYRKQHNLPPIPLSKSLSYVAALHARDLFLHPPNQGSCNFHSWSDKGFWTPFCYPKDENKKNSVWDKPRELTKYPSRAYEIVYWENNPLVTDTIIMVWKMEEYFNNFLLNTGKYQGKPWNAIGISVYENYACAWFGEATDPEGAAFVCGSAPEPLKKYSVKQSVKPVVKPSPKPPLKSKKAKTVTASPDTAIMMIKDSVASNTKTISQQRDSTSATYYIIVNSVLPKETANQLVNTLKTKGYPDSKLIEKNGKNNVSVLESHDIDALRLKLKEIRKIFKDAWLLKN